MRMERLSSPICRFDIPDTLLEIHRVLDPTRNDRDTLTIAFRTGTSLSCTGAMLEAEESFLVAQSIHRFEQRCGQLILCDEPLSAD